MRRIPARIPRSAFDGHVSGTQPRGSNPADRVPAPDEWRGPAQELLGGEDRA